MTFEEMAVELGWTVEELEDFGTFFDRAFAVRIVCGADAFCLDLGSVRI
jgi:hypothetical protein